MWVGGSWQGSPARPWGLVMLNRLGLVVAMDMEEDSSNSGFPGA